MNLRPYQTKAIEEIRRKFARGIRRVLLHLSTGGGKTVIFCQILKGVKERNKKAIIVVFGKDLIENASQRLFREGIEHGVLQGNHWNYKPREPIQVCSITTLYRRKLVPEADLVVIDEAHQSYNESYKWLLEQYQGKFILPVTATPHLKKGMRHVADTVVYPTTFRDLVANGYLVRPKYFAPTTLDLSDVKVDSKTGDYSLKDLDKKLDGFRLYGDVIAHYKELCNGAPSICFAINIRHSLMLCDLFNRAGIPCEHIDANTSLGDRQTVYKKLETGEIKVIVNVGVATTGVDIPCLRAVISCRPTKSYNLYIQMLGRGTRPFSGKDVFYVLDHANNILEHGMIEDEQECNLDGAKKDSVKRGKICEKCFFVWMPEKPGEPCPECGHINVSPEKGEGKPKLDNEDAKLVEIKSSEDLMHLKIKKQIDRWIDMANKRSYKPGFVFYKTVEKYDEKTAKKYWTYIKAKVELHQDP